MQLTIVEDHGLIGHAMAAALREELQAAVHLVDVHEHADVVMAVTASRPDLALLDLDLGVLGSCVRFIGPLREEGIEVVVVTAETSRRRHAECLEAGAVTVLNKSQPFPELIDTVRRVLAGERVLDPAARAEALAELRVARQQEGSQRAAFETLTPREAVILSGLMDGHSVRQLAARESVSFNTVRSQVRSILQKLGVHSQTAAVTKAHQAGWRP